MSQFQPMETSTLITFQVLLENIYGEFYEVLLNILLKLHINSYGGNIYLSDDVWVMFFIHFEVLSKPFPFYLKVANIVNYFLRSHKLLTIFPLGCFS